MSPDHWYNSRSVKKKKLPRNLTMGLGMVVESTQKQKVSSSCPHECRPEGKSLKRQLWFSNLQNMAYKPDAAISSMPCCITLNCIVHCNKTLFRLKMTPLHEPRNQATRAFLVSLYTFWGVFVDERTLRSNCPTPAFRFSQSLQSSVRKC